MTQSKRMRYNLANGRSYDQAHIFSLVPDDFFQVNLSDGLIYDFTLRMLIAFCNYFISSKKNMA